MWFTENAWPPIVIAGFCALISFAVWNRDRRNLYLVLGFLLLGATGAIYAVERAIITDGERLQEDVVMMCDQFRRRDPRTLDHFSESAPEWKEVCRKAMGMVEVRNDLRVTDLQTTFTNEQSSATVHFRANATISAMGMTAHHPFRCVMTYQKEGGQWKIVDVERLDPIKGGKMDVMEHR